MIFKSVDKTALPLYDGISMEIEVSSELKTERADGGIGGILLRETPVAPYKKDLSAFQRAAEYEKNFDISEWKFFMAFDGARRWRDARRENAGSAHAGGAGRSLRFMGSPCGERI